VYLQLDKVVAGNLVGLSAQIVSDFQSIEVVCLFDFYQSDTSKAFAGWERRIKSNSSDKRLLAQWRNFNCRRHQIVLVIKNHDTRPTDALVWFHWPLLEVGC
jgi:hypothetical protein